MFRKRSFSSANAPQAKRRKVDTLNTDAQKKFYFEHLPIEITKEVASFAKLPSTAHLFQTCSSIHTLFNAHGIIEQQAANELLENVLKGEASIVKMKIAAKPELLFMKATATDYSGRTFYCSPWQAMLGAEDLDLCNEVKQYIDNVVNGRATALEQLNEQFPNGFLIEPNTYNFTTLINAISMEQFVDGQVSQATEAVFKQFREDFTALDVKTGRHFNIQILLDAMQIFVDNYGIWSKKQLTLLWVKVVGYLQRLLPACYVQAFCNGYSLFANDADETYPLMRTSFLGESLFRTFTLSSHQGEYYPLDSNPDARLGFDIAFCSIPEELGGGGAVWTWDKWKDYGGAMEDTPEQLYLVKESQFIQLNQWLQRSLHYRM